VKHFTRAFIAAQVLAASVAMGEVVQEKTDDGYVATFKFDVNESDVQPGMIQSVHLAGSFNGWNGGALSMTDPDGDGVFTVELPLQPGEYQYKFVINGDRWITDPTDDADLRVGDNYGGQNSGVVIGPDVREAPAIKDGHINLDFVAHDPMTDAVLVDQGTVRLRIRALPNDVDIVHVVGNTFPLPKLEKVGEVRGYEVFEGVVRLEPTSELHGEPVLRYSFLLRDDLTRVLVGSDGRAEFAVEDLHSVELSGGGDVAPFEIPAIEFDIPDWTHHAVWYQIFPERFRNANPDNDPGRFPYENLVGWNTNWWDVLTGETPPDATSDNFYTGAGDVWDRRYGGDLQGVREKLPYLKELGVTALYFNPIFEGESMHKYDTADFRHVDDNFGIRHAGMEYPPSFGDGAKSADPATWVWSPSDKLFLDFLQEAKAQGFKVVIDGVFNHVGRAHPFFQDVLEKGPQSEYADWFAITDWGDPANWRPMENPYEVHGKPGGIQWIAWDQPNGHLPAFKKDAELGLAEGPRQHIFDITRRWLDPDGDPATDDGIDGWRLDVPQDIPIVFWRDWREVVKEANPDAYVVGEIWSWADEWLKGDVFDAVMNYQFAMDAQDFFVDQRTATSPSQFMSELEELVTRYPRPVTYAQQNLMGSHDTDRLASMFVNPDRPYDGANRPQDNARNFDPPYSDREPDAQERARMRQLVLFQHAFVGAPMTYYGDEAGMWAPDDPSNRQPFPWPDRGPYQGSSDGFDQDTFDYFQRAIAIRTDTPALRTGTFEPILADDQTGVVAFARTAEDGKPTYVVLNRSDKSRSVTLSVAAGSYEELVGGATIELGEDGRPVVIPGEPMPADGESLTIDLEPWGVAILRFLN
jgi:glycosidase